MLWLTDSRWLGFRMDGGWRVMAGVWWLWWWWWWWWSAVGVVVSLSTAWKWCCDGAADLGDDDI